MNSIPKSPIRSQLGLRTLLLCIFLIFNPTWISYLTFGPSPNNLPIPIEVLLMVLVIVAVHIGALVFILTAKFEVTAELLITKTVFGVKQYPLSQIASLQVLPVYGAVPFFGFLYRVIIRGSSVKINVPAAFYANGGQLTKVIIERALEANPSFEVDSSILLVYGRPPYNRSS